MENVKTTGIYFNEADIKKIVERYIDWDDVTKDQIFCVRNIMNDNTPIGTSIIVGVDGIKCDEDSNIIRLILSAGMYELIIKTEQPNNALSVRFYNTLHVPGTYGCLQDGVLYILTDEEKEFSDFVEEALEDRDDIYAQSFRRNNIRPAGARGLFLLEKIKNEIDNDEILSSSGITPIQLISVFIEKTESYLDSCKAIEKLSKKIEQLTEKKNNINADDIRAIKRVDGYIELATQKLKANESLRDFCLATINAAIIPLLDATI